MQSYCNKEIKKERKKERKKILRWTNLGISGGGLIQNGTRFFARKHLKQFIKSSFLLILILKQNQYDTYTIQTSCYFLAIKHHSFTVGTDYNCLVVYLDHRAGINRQSPIFLWITKKTPFSYLHANMIIE